MDDFCPDWTNSKFADIIKSYFYIHPPEINNLKIASASFFVLNLIVSFFEILLLFGDQFLDVINFFGVASHEQQDRLVTMRSGFETIMMMFMMEILGLMAILYDNMLVLLGNGTPYFLASFRILLNLLFADQFMVGLIFFDFLKLVGALLSIGYGFKLPPPPPKQASKEKENDDDKDKDKDTSKDKNASKDIEKEAKQKEKE